MNSFSSISCSVAAAIAVTKENLIDKNKKKSSNSIKDNKIE